MMPRHFLTLPQRSCKPRQAGITHVLDKGIGLRQVEDLVASAADYVDLVKLGWGTGYITQDLRDKIKLYRDAGLPVYFGGTLLELAILQGRFDDYREMIQGLGVSHVELSTGIIDLSVEEKVHYIHELKQDFVVLTEVGSKDPQKILPPYRWVEAIRAELDAGAWKVICEARESGTVGLFHTNGEVNSGLVDEIVNNVEPSKLIFEAPQKTQQVWFIRKFGSDVNLGNIATFDVIPLETLRLGLRGDTMADFHDVEGWNLREALAGAWHAERPGRDGATWTSQGGNGGKQ